jgi:hypothetical protein
MNTEAELIAAAELHERSMQIIEDALGSERPNGTTWRAQQIANEICLIRARLERANRSLISITPCSDGLIEAVLSDGQGHIQDFYGIHVTDPDWEAKLLIVIGKYISRMQVERMYDGNAEAEA